MSPIGITVLLLASLGAFTLFTWRKLAGPWFDNAIATLEDRDDGLLLRWEKGVVGDDPQESWLELVDEAVIRPR